MNTFFIFNFEDHPMLTDKVSYYQGVTYRNCDYEKYFKSHPELWTEKRPVTGEVTFSNYDDLSFIKAKNQPMIRTIANKGELAKLLHGSGLHPVTYTFGISLSSLKHWRPPKNSLWFLKKSSDLTYGGFDVFPIMHYGDINATMQEIKMKIKESNKNPKYYSSTFVIQRAIEPMLIKPARSKNLHKFDIRAYGLMVRIGPGYKFEYYFFKKYLLRMSIKPYDPSNLDKSVMLTNTTFAKESGISDLSTLTEVNGPDEYHNSVYQTYVDFCKYYLRRLEEKYKNYANPSINIVGIDFIFDSKGKPYILEVNKSPQLYCDEERREKFHRNLENDMFSDDFFDISFNAILKNEPYKYSTKNYYRVSTD